MVHTPQTNTRKARYDYCFVVTYGRSGSTLMQGILNAIPGYFIRGENAGVMNALHSAFVQARSWARKYAGVSNDDPTNSWYGISGFDEGAYCRAARSLVIDAFIRPPPGTRCMGFKEIRFDFPDLADFLDFQEHVFPNCCFVFHFRSLDATSKSDWWKNNPKAIDELTTRHRRLSEAYWARLKAGKTNMIVTRHELHCREPAALEELFTFLGEPFEREAVERVLDKLHSA